MHLIDVYEIVKLHMHIYMQPKKCCICVHLCIVITSYTSLGSQFFFVIRIWITCISLYLLVGLLGKSLKSFKTLEVGVLITICPGHDFDAAILVSLEQLLVTLNFSFQSLVLIYFWSQNYPLDTYFTYQGV